MSNATSISDIERAEHLNYADGKGVKRISVFNDGVQINTATEETQLLVNPVNSGARKNIEFVHSKNHDGLLFSFCEINTAIVNNAVINYLIVTGSKSVHLVWETEGDIAMQIDFFKSTTTSANGTPLAIMNRNDTSANTPLTTIFKAPTITADGSSLCMKRSGSASATSKAGGADRASNEWILAPNAKYLFRVTSLSGASASLNFSLDFIFYEV